MTRRPSVSLVVAFLALVVALGGVSYAAITLPKNSVGTPQLKKGAVTTKKIKGDAVTGAKVKESSLVVPGGTKAYSIAAFQPKLSGMTYDVEDNLLEYTGGSFDFFVARLDLPDGATVSHAEVYGIDNGADGFVIILRRIDVRTGQAINLRLTASAGASAVTRAYDASPDAPFVVDNDNYDYVLMVEFSSATPTLRLAGATVDYSAHPLR